MADFTIMTWNIQQFGKEKGSKNDYRYQLILQILQITDNNFKHAGVPNDKIPDIFVIVELSNPSGPEILKNLTEDINGSLPSGTTTKYGYICSASQITSYNTAEKKNNSEKNPHSERIGFIYNKDLFTPFDPSGAQAPTEFPIYDVTEIKSSSPQNKYVAGKMRERSDNQIATAFPGGRPPAIAHFSVNKGSNNQNPLVILAWHTSPAPSTAWSQIQLIFSDTETNSTPSIPNNELINNPFIVTGDLNIDSIDNNKYIDKLTKLLENRFTSAIEKISTHNSNKGLDYIYYNNKLTLVQDSNKVDQLDKIFMRILIKDKYKEISNLINRINGKKKGTGLEIRQRLEKFKKDDLTNRKKTVKMITDTVSDHYPILAKFKIQ